jgi:hypothetical protein
MILLTTLLNDIVKTPDGYRMIIMEFPVEATELTTTLIKSNTNKLSRRYEL